MVRARRELGAIFKPDHPGWLSGPPMCEHVRSHISTVMADLLGPYDLVANLDVGQRFRLAVCHQDSRFTLEAVDAPMLAAPVGVDRVVEADVGRVVGGDDGPGAIGLDRLDDAARLLFLPPAVVDRLSGVLVEAPRRIR